MIEMISLTFKRTDGTVLGEYDSFPDKTAREEIKEIQDSGQNVNGLSATAAALLITILRNGMYSSDQSANITALESALASSGENGSGGGTETPDTPETGVEQTGAVLSIVSGVTVTQNDSILDIA